MSASHTDRFCTNRSYLGWLPQSDNPLTNSTVIEQQLITACVWTRSTSLSSNPTNSVESMEVTNGMGNVEANAQLEGNVIDYDSGP